MSEKFDIIFSNKIDFESYFNENDSALHRLQDLSNINILIGANNSGKSRFIRNLLKTPNLMWQNRRSLIKAIDSFNFYIKQNKFGGFNYSRNVEFLPYENFEQQILFEEILYEEEQTEILKKVNYNLKILNFLTKEKSRLRSSYFGENFTTLKEIDEKKINLTCCAFRN
ncbi:AAA family ATPase [Chryseobacterium mulctrae]|uniref:ATP-binding protein n=1 Tax=Chryseobacterium mulctrae TaxID=2576777 RepID=UPI001116CCC0|nr:ATP-binding protein [Chryseobacterium mulctrae]